MKNKSVLIGLIIISLVAIVLTIVISLVSKITKDWDETTVELQNLNRSYPVVTKKDSISGVITGFYDFSKSTIRQGGSTCLSLKDEREISFNYSSNGLYNPSPLHIFLKLNDSIVKKNMNDTLFVYRGNEVFYFVIDKMINRETETL